MKKMNNILKKTGKVIGHGVSDVCKSVAPLALIPGIVLSGACYTAVTTGALVTGVFTGSNKRLVNKAWKETNEMKSDIFE